MHFNALLVRRQVIRLISSKKDLPLARLLKATNFDSLGFDNLDLVEIILEVEKAFRVTIPDDLPLHSVHDLVNFICLPKLRKVS